MSYTGRPMTDASWQEFAYWKDLARNLQNENARLNQEIAAKKTMTDAELKAKIEAIILERKKRDCVEMAHPHLDDLLVETLRGLGFNESMDLYEQTPMWYE